jgi:hypothetical protein
MSTVLVSPTIGRRGAINLNNCGVILLSRHLWCDAMDTFKDAMRMMKSVVNQQGGAVSEQDLKLALDRAGQRTSIAFHNTTQVHQGPKLSVVSSQCDPAILYSYLNSNGCNHDTKCLVTIDPIGCEGWDTDFTDLESAFILYNFGIANSCLSFVSGCSLLKTSFQDNSYCILESTHALAFKLFRKALTRADLANPIMLINMLLTTSLMHMSSRNHDPGTSEEYRRSLKELAFLIKAHQKLLPADDQKYAPAA